VDNAKKRALKRDEFIRENAAKELETALSSNVQMNYNFEDDIDNVENYSNTRVSTYKSNEVITLLGNTTIQEASR